MKTTEGEVSAAEIWKVIYGISERTIHGDAQQGKCSRLQKSAARSSLCFFAADDLRR
jgi:hypothetical protein